MKTLRNQVCTGATLATFVALGAGPAEAQEAEPVVPPSNSAASQYTETFPTTGGQKKTDHAKDRSPAQALGRQEARRLEAKGPAGRAVAEIVAATAPVSSAPAGNRSGVSGAARSGSGQPSGRNSAETGSRGARSEATLGFRKEPSSGFGEVVGQATGLSGVGSATWLLPLALLGSILWSLVYLLGRRRPAE